jgi:hypothetical protein
VESEVYGCGVKSDTVGPEGAIGCPFTSARVYGSAFASQTRISQHIRVSSCTFISIALHLYSELVQRIRACSNYIYRSAWLSFAAHPNLLLRIRVTCNQQLSLFQLILDCGRE